MVEWYEGAVEKLICPPLLRVTNDTSPSYYVRRTLTAALGMPIAAKEMEDDNVEGGGHLRGARHRRRLQRLQSRYRHLRARPSKFSANLKGNVVDLGVFCFFLFDDIDIDYLPFSLFFFREQDRFARGEQDVLAQRLEPDWHEVAVQPSAQDPWCRLARTTPQTRLLPRTESPCTSSPRTAAGPILPSDGTRSSRPTSAASPARSRRMPSSTTTQRRRAASPARETPDP